MSTVCRTYCCKTSLMSCFCVNNVQVLICRQTWTCPTWLDFPYNLLYLLSNSGLFYNTKFICIPLPLCFVFCIILLVFRTILVQILVRLLWCLSSPNEKFEPHIEICHDHFLLFVHCTIYFDFCYFLFLQMV